MLAYKRGDKMIAAEKYTLEKYNLTLKAYLKQETNRGVSDCQMAKEFNVNRHTIANWKRLTGLITVKRAISPYTNKGDLAS